MIKKDILIGKLRKKLVETLIPLVDNDYVLVDLPYYSNVGDLLIWEGTECVLAKSKKKCIGRYSKETFKFRNLPENVMLIIQGGGNWSDLWIEHLNFRREIVRRYSQYKILMLPQSVYYSNQNELLKDADLFSKCRNLIICLRDDRSFELINSHFSNHILLLPDMAFGIEKHINNRLCRSDKILFLKRKDKEKNNVVDLSKYENDKYYDIKDWPFMEQKSLVKSLLFFMKHRVNMPYVSSILDYYAYHIYKPYVINSGISFVGSYNKIVSTRLHVVILAILLNVENIDIIDNSYHKIFNFIDTWAKNVDGVKKVK